MAALSTERSGLDAYEHYWYVARGYGKEGARQRQRQLRSESAISGTWGSAGDPVGTQTPMAQNRMFGVFARMAAGRVNDWESKIDPKATFGINKDRLVDKYGAKRIQSDIERERKKAIADNDDRQRDRAQDALLANAEAIEAGEKAQLVADIEAEFGSAFVADTLERARIDATEPEPDGPAVTDNTVERIAYEPVTFEVERSRPIRVSDPHGPEPAPEPANGPGPAAVESATPDPSNYSTARLFVEYQLAKVRNVADYGISEFLWNFLAAVLAPTESESAGSESAGPEQATLEVY